MMRIYRSNMEEQEQHPTLVGLPEDRMMIIAKLVETLGMEIG